MNLTKTLGFCYFTLGNCGQSKASTLEIPQNCVTLLLRNSKAKNQAPMQIPHEFFLIPENSTFLMNPWNFDILFLE